MIERATFTAAADDAAPLERAPLVVNKRELARALKVSLPTLNELVERYPDFPVKARGSNGVGWEFELEIVIEFLRAKDEAARQAETERAALFKQLELPVDKHAIMPIGELSPTQRRQLAEARSKERKLAIEMGLLVEVPKMRQDLQLAIGRLGRFFDTLPTQIAREHNLPEEVMRSIRRRLDDQRRSFVEELVAVMGAGA
jgi:phage terminase Nu1 subunit (DNA packaging protein)